MSDPVLATENSSLSSLKATLAIIVSVFSIIGTIVLGTYTFARLEGRVEKAQADAYAADSRIAKIEDDIQSIELRLESNFVKNENGPSHLDDRFVKIGRIAPEVDVRYVKYEELEGRVRAIIRDGPRQSAPQVGQAQYSKLRIEMKPVAAGQNTRMWASVVLKPSQGDARTELISIESMGSPASAEVTDIQLSRAEDIVKFHFGKQGGTKVAVTVSGYRDGGWSVIGGDLELVSNPSESEYDAAWKSR